MHVPTYQQPPNSPDGRRRRLVSALADLCRRDSATFAAVVRRADQLQASGVDPEVARLRALTEVQDRDQAPPPAE